MRIHAIRPFLVKGQPDGSQFALGQVRPWEVFFDAGSSKGSSVVSPILLDSRAGATMWFNIAGMSALAVIIILVELIALIITLICCIKTVKDAKKAAPLDVSPEPVPV